MKKKLILILNICLLWSVSLSAEISISPYEGSFGKNCIMEFDIVIDAYSEKILGTDILIETSMDYIDFVPSSSFTYYMPPQIRNKNIYLGAFSDLGKEFYGKEKFGTLYLKNNDNLDGYIKFDFKGKGITSDTNLSVIGGIDKLDKVTNGSYYFDLEPCVHNITDIEGGFSSIDNKQYLENMISGFNKNAKKHKLLLFFSKYGLNFILFVLVILSFYVFIKNKKFYNKGKK